MKNQSFSLSDKTIMLLPTKDVSPICVTENGTLTFTESIIVRGGEAYTPQLIYLISDAPIKERNWVFDIVYKRIVKVKSIKDKFVLLDVNDGLTHSNISNLKKIELTTDPKLIADGVPVIDENTKAFVKTDWHRNREVNFLTEFCKRWNESKTVSLGDISIKSVRHYQKDTENEKDKALPISEKDFKYVTELIEVMQGDYYGNMDEAIAILNKVKQHQKDIKKEDVEKLVFDLLNKHLPKETKWTIETERGVQNAMKEALQSQAGGFSLEKFNEAIELLRGWDSGEAIQGLPEKTDLFLESLTKETPKGDIVIECETMIILKSNMSTKGVGEEFSGYQERIKLNKDGQPVLYFK